MRAIAVVIPTCRRRDLLARCVSALVVQTVGVDDYEIVIADEAADPEIARAVAEWAASSGRAIHHVPVTGAHGPAAARNAGWRATRCPVIAFTDDDTMPEASWLEEGLRALLPDVAALGGRVVSSPPERPTDPERDPPGRFVTANAFVRRDALEAVGGFDERFEVAWREDSDLEWTLVERGLRVESAPRAVVVHPARAAGFAMSLSQQKKSQYDALLYKKHPALYRQIIGPAPRGYYAALGAVAVGGAAALAGSPWLAVASAVGWTAGTLAFAARRLAGASRAPAHVARTLVTAALIPPLSVFWRLAGGLRFGVGFY